MWWFRWHARRFFRSVMNPVNADRAVKWHRRLRFLYILVAMNASIIAFKQYYRKKRELKEEGVVQDLTSSHKKARLMQLGDVHIIRTGIGVPTKTYDINSEEYDRQLRESNTKTMGTTDSHQSI